MTKMSLESLATKHDLALVEKDLKIEMGKVRYDCLRFVIWTGVGVVAALGGMMAKGFHWL